jgi:hypothetical protein
MSTIDLILHSLLISSLSWIFVITIGKEVDVKPFNCTICMGFWLGLLWFIIVEQTILCLPLAGFTSLITQVIDRWMIKLY